MIAGLRIWIALAANVAVAGISLTGSAVLWSRATESAPELAPVPTLPTIVGEASVPYVVKPRGNFARRAERTAAVRSRTTAANVRKARRIARRSVSGMSRCGAVR